MSQVTSREEEGRGNILVLKDSASRLCRTLLIALLVGVGASALVLTKLAVKGLSARDEPSRLEELAARSFRRLATPNAVRTLRNPVPLSEETLAAGRGHFADHCATCHGNDGSGQTEIGRGLYPKAPDMRLTATQSLTDGELFSIIRNGIRLTGMPAWGSGTAEDDLGTWQLVHFIRHMPKLSSTELEDMRRLNPRSPAEIEREREVEKFLAGGATPAPPHSH